VRQSRGTEGQIEATVFTSRAIELDPPGIVVLLEAFYEE